MKNNRKRKKKMASKKIREKKLKQKQNYQALRPVHDQKKKCDSLFSTLRFIKRIELIGIIVIIVWCCFVLSNSIYFSPYQTDTITVKEPYIFSRIGWTTTYNIITENDFYMSESPKNITREMFLKEITPGSTIKVEYQKRGIFRTKYWNKIQKGNTTIFQLEKKQNEISSIMKQIFIVDGVIGSILILILIFPYRKTKIKYKQEYQKYIALQREYESSLSTIQMGQPEK